MKKSINLDSLFVVIGRSALGGVLKMSLHWGLAWLRPLSAAITAKRRRITSVSSVAHSINIFVRFSRAHPSARH